MKYKDYLATMRGCPFCVLVQPIVTENESAFLTYSLAPYRPDHLLVIPKKHIEHVLDITEQMMSDLDLLQRTAVHMLNKLGHENITLLVREGMASGKSIPHLHYHLIPDVVLGDVEHNGKEREILSPGEKDTLMKRLFSVL